MSNINQRERITQHRVVQFFQDELGYRYLGNWHSRADNKNIERDILSYAEETVQLNLVN